MAGRKTDEKESLEKRNGEIAIRLRFARERLELTQDAFGYRLGIPRQRMASYEEGRAALPCDVGIRICRYFFISEFWLAYGFVDENEARYQTKADFGFDVRARLTMSLASEQIALTVPPGLTFAEGFESHLKDEYLRLAKIQGGWPRIVPLPNESPAYIENAVLCMMEFWESGVGTANFNEFFLSLIDSGQKLYARHVEAVNNIESQSESSAKKSSSVAKK